MHCVITDSFELSIKNCILMFEIYVFQILHLLIECVTHCLAISFTDLDRPGPLAAP